MHAIAETALTKSHSQHFKSVDTERIFNKDEIVGGYPKTMVVSDSLVGFDGGDDFGPFQWGFCLDLICSLDGGNLHDVVSGL